MQIRLDKFISEGLPCSRQDAKKLISKGCVTINGTVVQKSDYKADSGDEIRLNGKIIGREEFVYIMLNKPRGVVSASRDKGDVTVIDLVQKDFPRRNLFPAGRLDKESTGFVLITDDGKFAHDILSPKHHVPKTYIVTVDSPITDRVKKAFEAGVTLSDGSVMKSAEIQTLENDTSAKIILHQGVYHQIKRMLGVYDIGVNTLHRTAIGALEMPKNLAPSQYLKLSDEQVQKIAKSLFTEN